VPCPHRTEGIKEADILKQVRIQPETGRSNDHGDDEQDEPEDAHDEEQSDETEHPHTEVPHTEPEHRRPKRKQYHTEEPHHQSGSGERHGPCSRLVKERVVEVIADILLLLDLDVPLALDALGVLGAFLLDFGHAQRKERAR